MNINERMNRFSRDALNFFFPRRCPFCGAVVDNKELLCADCRKELPFTEEHACVERSFGRCAAPLYYEERVRSALLEYKFHGKMGGLDCFGRLLAECAAEEYMGCFDTITWVPVSHKRLKQRGFDQSRLLAASACVDWHTQPLETLRKVQDNPPQSGIDDADRRRANVLGVYEPVEEHIRGRRLLLVDDICTTGATLGECVRVLKSAGAEDVVCLTLAVRRHSHVHTSQENGIK